MGGARRGARSALSSVSSAVPWHPALVPRDAWGSGASGHALANLRSEAQILPALVGGLAALSARESLGVPPPARWVLAGDGLPAIEAGDSGTGAPAATPGELVRLFLSLLGARPARGEGRPVLPRRHPHGVALSIWASRWLDAPSGARESVVDLLEVLASEGLGPGLPAAWGVAAPWEPSGDLGAPGLRRVRVAGPATRGALASWCARAGVTPVALGETSPYPFASLEPLVRSLFGVVSREAQRWLSERLRAPGRLADELGAALAASPSGFCLWPAESLDESSAGVLDRCAAGLTRPLVLAGECGEPAGAFGGLFAVALPKTGESWFRLHALAACGDHDTAVETAASRPEGLLGPGASLLCLPGGAVPDAVPPHAAPDPTASGPAVAVANLRASGVALRAGRPAEAALLKARAFALAGQTELASGLLEEAAGCEAEWIRTKVWERRQDFAEMAAAAARADGPSLPKGLRGEVRATRGLALWLSGELEAGRRQLERARESAEGPDSAVLATLALATCRLLAGDAEGAQDLLADAEKQLPGCRRPLATILWHQRRGLLFRKRGLYGPAADSFSRAAELAAAGWDHWMEAVSLLETGNAHRLQYRFDEARELLGRAEEGLCALGLTKIRASARFDRMLCDAESGRLLEAQETLEADLASCRPPQDRAVDRYWLARMLQLRGEPSPALDQIALALEDVRRRPDPEVEAPLQILRARLLLDAHQTGRLRGALGVVRGLAVAAPDPDDRLDAMSVLLEASAKGHDRPERVPVSRAEATAKEASPGAVARWALARARARAGDPEDLYTEARALARQVSDPALETEALWGLANAGRLPALAPEEAERIRAFLSRNRVRGETRGLLPLLAARTPPPPEAIPDKPGSPLLLLEEARRGRVDLPGCLAALDARGALLRAPGAAPLWEGALPAGLREALAQMAGMEGLVPAPGGWVLGASGRGGTWAGFAWVRSEPPGGEAASLARLWTAVLPPPEVSSPDRNPEGRPDPLLDRLLLGHAPALLELRRRLTEAAPFSFPVLLTGEPGVGKEACARALHMLSARSSKPWVPANCANLSPTLAASLLFGHRRGAFTGADRDATGLVEAARGGTLFLDEVGELPGETQAQVLRFLQDGSYSPLGETRPRSSDARIVAATNRDLERLVQEGRFRADLFHRLNVIRVEVPPLRQRRGDIPLLFGHFLGEAARAEGRLAPSVDPEVWGHLMAWRWPGNVRELQNLARSLLVACSSGGRISVAHLPEVARSAPSPPGRAGGLRSHLANAEREAVEEALGRSGGNISAAARALGITRQALARKLARGPLAAPAPAGEYPPVFPEGGPDRRRA